MLNTLFYKFCIYVDDTIFPKENSGEMVAFIVDQAFIDDCLIFCLLGSDRPLHESFAPNLIDQREAMENQFVGRATFLLPD